jgi:hypothetical protein
MTKSFTDNNTIYTTTKFKIVKTQYSVLVATGKFNYVLVKKETANPYGTLGTQFENFDAAIKHYKNASIKLELLKIQIGL